MKYEDEEIFEEKDCTQVLSKKYLLSRMNFLDDIGYSHKQQVITPNCSMHFVFITSLNGVKLNVPLQFYEADGNEKKSKFNLREVNDNYGHYFIIRGKFSYSAMIGEENHGLFIRNTTRITGATFNIGFINSCAAIIYDGKCFDSRDFIKNHNVLASQRCGNSGIIFVGELDQFDKKLF